MYNIAVIINDEEEVINSNVSNYITQLQKENEELIKKVLKLHGKNVYLKILIDFKSGLSINGLAKKYKIIMNKVDKIIRKQLKDK